MINRKIFCKSGPWLLTVPPLLAYVATLPHENINVRKQAIDDKLHGMVV